MNGRAAWWLRIRSAPRILIWPIFLVDGENKRVAIPTMPGVERLSVDAAVAAAEEAAKLDIPVIALFPNTPESKKTVDGREAENPDNLVCRAVRAIKKAVPDIGIMCDVCPRSLYDPRS